METYNSHIVNIWLADDDEDDCEFFKDILLQISPLATLTIIPNGEVLLNSLTAASKPDILFLDINMPCRDGLDCLVEIRAQRHFSKLPIIIFSSSIQTKHIDASYDYGANLFYSKPTSFQELIAGLSNLLSMDWSDPYTITKKHYINNKYVPFKIVME